MHFLGYFMLTYNKVTHKDIFHSNHLPKRLYTNYVDKKRWEGSPKMSNLVNFYKVENVNVGG